MLQVIMCIAGGAQSSGTVRSQSCTIGRKLENCHGWRRAAVLPGEDASFNSIIARTPSGRDLLRDVEATGAIRIIRELTMRDATWTTPSPIGCARRSRYGPGWPGCGRRDTWRLPTVIRGQLEEPEPAGCRGGWRPSTIPAFAPADGCTAHCRTSS